MTTTSASATAHEIPARQGMRRFALRIDAVVSGANGVAYLALAGPLADLFGVSGSLLRPIGAFFLVWAAALWLLSSRETVTRGEMIAVAALNAVWVAGSLVFSATGAAEPDTAGSVWVLLQALLVSGFVGLQLAVSRD